MQFEAAATNGRVPPDGLDDVTRAAIERVDEHADDDWKDAADRALHGLALRLPTLTPDDLWDVIDRPREPRASGPVFLRARRAGWIEPTGELVRSRNVRQHRNVITEYRSLIYRGRDGGEP
jgi:hypothetical protein